MSWPQTCRRVLYYRSPASMLCHVTTMKTANLYLADAPPQKLISPLPQYYHMVYNMRPGQTVEAGLLISLATTSDFWFQPHSHSARSHRMSQYFIHGKSIEDCSLVVFTWNSGNKPKGKPTEESVNLLLDELSQVFIFIQCSDWISGFCNFKSQVVCLIQDVCEMEGSSWI